MENFTHPDLLFAESNREMRLDVFVPTLSLAFEFNGPQHYKDIHFFGPSKQYTERDEEKKMICKLHGITVIDVPYWWNGSKTSLAATIKKIKPDVKLAITISDSEAPIPESAPRRKSSGQTATL